MTVVMEGMVMWEQSTDPCVDFHQRYPNGRLFMYWLHYHNVSGKLFLFEHWCFLLDCEEYVCSTRKERSIIFKPEKHTDAGLKIFGNESVIKGHTEISSMPGVLFCFKSIIVLLHQQPQGFSLMESLIFLSLPRWGSCYATAKMQ